jgi:NAD(P)-dependent dehydrogenase (short-subunit alcohol dehydrogenase family)
VTGAASGIGLACATLLAERGAGRLILADRNGPALEALRLPGDIVRRVGDVAEPGNWTEPLPPLDHAVINAGVPGIGPLVDMPFEEWRRVLAVNLDGVFLSLQAALRAMRDGGSAVIVASAAGVRAAKGTAAYSASKAAVIQLARVAALESAERKIRVNVIAPGGVESPIWHEVDWFKELEAKLGREEAYRSLAKEGTPLGRFAVPEEIAAQIAFLLSNETSGYTTGSVLITDGGYTVM